jgi:hypothetical protein
MTTPSGLIIGIILMIFLSKNYLNCGVFDVKAFINPLHIYEALVSPGWIRQETNMTFLKAWSEALLVIVTIGIAKPIKLYVKTSIVTYSFGEIDSISFIMSEYV